GRREGAGAYRARSAGGLVHVAGLQRDRELSQDEAEDAAHGSEVHLRHRQHLFGRDPLGCRAPVRAALGPADVARDAPFVSRHAGGPSRRYPAWGGHTGRRNVTESVWGTGGGPRAREGIWA